MQTPPLLLSLSRGGAAYPFVGVGTVYRQKHQRLYLIGKVADHQMAQSWMLTLGRIHNGAHLIECA